MSRRPPPRVPGPPLVAKNLTPEEAALDPNNLPADFALPPDPKPITSTELDAMKPDEKTAVLSATLAQVVNYPVFAEKLRDERIASYAAAEADGRPWTDTVVVLAHNQSYELFFKDHPKLDVADADANQPIGTHRARMLEALSPEESHAYEVLVEMEKRETEPEKIVTARAARVAFECNWATARWRWKRHAEKFFPGGVVGWNAKWFYRSDLEDDPIYEDTKHPMHPAFLDAADIPEKGFVKFLILGGNAAMAQKCVIPPDVEDVIIETTVMVPQVVGEMKRDPGPERIVAGSPADLAATGQTPTE